MYVDLSLLTVSMSLIPSKAPEVVYHNVLLRLGKQANDILHHVETKHKSEEASQRPSIAVESAKRSATPKGASELSSLASPGSPDPPSGTIGPTFGPSPQKPGSHSPSLKTMSVAARFGPRSRKKALRTQSQTPEGPQPPVAVKSRSKDIGAPLPIEAPDLKPRGSGSTLGSPPVVPLGGGSRKTVRILPEASTASTATGRDPGGMTDVEAALGDLMKRRNASLRRLLSDMDREAVVQGAGKSRLANGLTIRFDEVRNA